MSRPAAATLHRIARNIAFFYLDEGRDIARVTRSNALPPDALKAKYATLKTKITAPKKPAPATTAKRAAAVKPKTPKK